MTNAQFKAITIQVTEKEKKLIDFWRKLKVGNFQVYVEGNEPQRIVNIKDSIKL